MQVTQSAHIRHVKEAKRYFFIQGISNAYLMNVVSGVFLIALLKSLEANAILIGFAGSLMMIATSAQVMASPLIERRPLRKKTITSTYMIRSALLALACGALWSQHLWHWMDNNTLAAGLLLLSFFSLFLLNLGHPIFFSWITDLFPEQSIGQFFGQLSFFSTLFATVFLLGIGPLVDEAHHRQDLALFTWLWLGLVAFQLVAGFINERVHEPAMKPSIHGSHFFKNFKQLFELKDYRRLLTVVALFQFSTTATGTFGAIYLHDDLHLSWGFVSLASAVWMLSFSLCSPLWGFLSQRLPSPKLFLIIGLSIHGLNTVPFLLLHRGYSFMSPLHLKALILILYVIFALGFSAFSIAIAQLQTICTPKENRTMLIGSFNSCAAFLGALGSLFIGFALDQGYLNNFDHRFSNGLRINWFLGLMIGQSVLMILGLIVTTQLRKGLENSKGVFLSMVRGGFITNLYHLWVFKNSKCESQIATHIKNKVTSSSKIAIPDLISKLNDPSAHVRIRSIEALARLKAMEAAPSLIQKLGSCYGVMDMEIIWCLGQIQNPEACPALIERLQHDNEEVCILAVKALNNIATPEAMDAIGYAYQSEKRVKASLVMAQAITRFKPDIVFNPTLEAYLQASDQDLKQQYALILAEVLKVRQDFYASYQLSQSDPDLCLDKLMSDKIIGIALDQQLPDNEEQAKSIYERVIPFLSGRAKTLCQQFQQQAGFNPIDLHLALQLFKQSRKGNIAKA